MSFAERFTLNFIDSNRWQYIVNGLGVTLEVTFFALIIGVVLGFIIGAIRSTYDLNGTLKIPNAICKVYITIIRGTPVVVQLLIIYFVIFGSVNVDKLIVEYKNPYSNFSSPYAQSQYAGLILNSYM